MFQRKLMMGLCLMAVSAVFASAQTQESKPAQPAPKKMTNRTPVGETPTFIRPETPEQRKARLGTAEDPGPNPDPEKHYWRFGKSQHIERYDRQWAVYEEEEGIVRPFGFVNSSRELYQHNDKYVWVWMDDPAPETQETKDAAVAAAEPTMFRQFSEADLDFFQKIRSEFTELTPPTNDTVVRFEESSKGLPTGGSWRNSLAVADMNGDGFPDLIAPPERAGGVAPVIFLGDGAGNWKVWQAKWPHGLDYGSVAAADFNKDGKMDLAFGVHLTGVTVFLGDGNGKFTESRTGLPNDFPTRRVIAADVDRDGYPDVVAISEGPTAIQNAESTNYSKVSAFLGRDKAKRWERVDVSQQGVSLGGDWIVAGKFNGDNYPDFATASIYFNSTSTLWLSNGPKNWKTVANAPNSYPVPPISYYFANTAGAFTSKKIDDAIMSYVRFWPTDLNPRSVPAPPATNIVGIDRVSFVNGQPKRASIVRWPSNRGIWGLGNGDFDGDGNLDLIYTRYDPREAVILLGDGKGGFTRAKIDGLKLEPNTNYDVKVADVNGDGKPDVIVMYESSGKSAFSVRDGSIHVFLNRGTTPAAAAAK